MDRDYIRKCLVGYKQIDQTIKEIQQVIHQYKGLNVRSSPYVFNDGTTHDLACLDGTIPVSFKGVFYNIPISIHLTKTFPSHPPICFVKPTSDMNIKVSMFVDQNGKIYLPYLHEWAPGNSNLLELIQVMVVTFGDHPPVFSKPKSGVQSTSPYPTQSHMPMPGMGVGRGGYGVGVQYPPYLGMRGGTGPYPPPSPSQYPPVTAMPTPYPPHSTPSPYPTQPHIPPTQDNTSSGCNSGTITEEHIRLSLVSAIEHKVKRRLEEQTGQQKAELEILRQTGNELAQGKDAIQALLHKLNREKTELERNLNILKEKDSELERCISELTQDSEIDVDEAVTTTAPLYKQIVNSYAEEAATEDAIYYMGEALRRGVIDLDVFLKQVRSLSRKQFMLRALMHKCRLKAGLAG